MRLRYIYSACVVIETSDIRILCDPWFTPGAYDGSWLQWPPVENPIETIGASDAIYISHIHPDHYDPAFLRLYLAQFPKARLLIGAQTPPILERKLQADGFLFETIDTLRIGRTELFVLPNRSRSVNVDTALVVRADGKSIANLNDNPFDEEQVAAIRDICHGPPTLALLPYGGATNHPQTFLFPTEQELVAAATIKERHFLDIFHRYIAALEPLAVLPFAGKYWLGGPLARLNKYRGMPDPVQAAAEAGERAFVLADGGQAYFDLDEMKASDVRTAPYDSSEAEAFLTSSTFHGYAYEQEIQPNPDHALPLAPLLTAAVRNARRRVAVTEPCWICIQPSRLDHDGFGLNQSNVIDSYGLERVAGGKPLRAFPQPAPGIFLCFDPSAAADVQPMSAEQVSQLSPRTEIYIDDRYLFGLLSRLYHWNNAMIGSHYLSRRSPDIFRRDVADFFDYLQV